MTPQLRVHTQQFLKPYITPLHIHYSFDAGYHILYIHITPFTHMLHLYTYHVCLIYRHTLHI